MTLYASEKHAKTIEWQSSFDDHNYPNIQTYLHLTFSS